MKAALPKRQNLFTNLQHLAYNFDYLTIKRYAGHIFRPSPPLPSSKCYPSKVIAYIIARQVTTLSAFSLSSASLIHRSLLISTPFAFNDVTAGEKQKVHKYTRIKMATSQTSLTYMHLHLNQRVTYRKKSEFMKHCL